MGEIYMQFHCFEVPDNICYRYYFFQHLSNKLGARTIGRSGNREYEKGDKKVGSIELKPIFES